MILMNDFKAEPVELQEQEMAAAARVLKSGWFILGQEVNRFEKEWANFCGVNHAVGVGNGMDAIEIGLRALDIGQGDEVITTPMTAMATVLAIMRVGAVPVFADVDAATALLDPVSVKAQITKRTKAVLLVHLYGQVRDMDHWARLCSTAGIHLLEDCAQAHGAKWQGKVAGSMGTFGAYSFYPTKNLGAKGDGGALVTNDPALAARAQTIRNYGQTKRYIHGTLGVNSRLDELQAAILSVRLNWLERFNQRRQAIARMYFQGVTNPEVELLAPPCDQQNHVYHLFVIRSSKRDALAQFLKERGVETLIHYPIPAHEQSCLPPEKLLIRFPSAEKHGKLCLSIPCHPQLTDEQAQHVIDAVNAFR